MFREIVFPNNNETEFLQIASKLGIRKIYFVYDFDEKTQQQVEKINGYKNLRIEIGFLVNLKNIKKAIGKSDLLVAKSSDKDKDFIESKKISLIYGFEEIAKKDYIHQRASGLNHILCDMLNKNNISVGFSYGNLSGDSKAISLLIGRLMQNIRLCRKYKVQTAIASFSENPFSMRAPHDVISLFSLLGMDRKKAKDSLMTRY